MSEIAVRERMALESLGSGGAVHLHVLSCMRLLAELTDAKFWKNHTYARLLPERCKGQLRGNESEMKGMQ